MSSERFIAVVLLLVFSGIVARADVILRSGQRVSQPIESLSLDGVRLGGESGRVLGWDAVYFIEGEYESEAGTYREWSDQVWRAKVRLSRGDLAMATPMFEALFARVKEQRIGGPTGLLIAESTLRCRVAQSNHGAAIEAWIVAMDIRSTGQRLSGESGTRGLIDTQTQLVPGLPPIWLTDSDDAKILTQMPIEEPKSDATPASVLTYLYQRCALQSLGVDYTGTDDLRGVAIGPGVEFLLAISRSLSSDVGERAAARSELLIRIDQQPGTWQEAWSRAAVGRSLLLESAQSERDRGVLHLLHLPARFQNSQPHLAAVSLAEIAKEISARGDRAAVDRIRHELAEKYPSHPAAEWLDRVLSE